MFAINCAILALLLLKSDMGVGAAMFGGGRQEAQEVEQRPCEGAKSSEGMTFQTGLRKSLMGFIYLYVLRPPKSKKAQARAENQKSR